MKDAALETKIVTIGTGIACSLLIFFGILAVIFSHFYVGVPALIIFGLISFGIIKGVRSAYVSARHIYGAVAILAFLNALNPGAYLNIGFAEGLDTDNFIPIFAQAMILGTLCYALFRCLGAHAKWREAINPASLDAKIVTIGVVIACCLLVYFQIRAVIYTGGSILVFLLIVWILACLGVIKGYRLAYASIRFVYLAVAMVAFLMSVNPFAMNDAVVGEGSEIVNLLRFLAEIVSIGIFCMLLSWCLEEHAKLRGIESIRRNQL